MIFVNLLPLSSEIDLRLHYCRYLWWMQREMQWDCFLFKHLLWSFTRVHLLFPPELCQTRLTSRIEVSGDLKNLDKKLVHCTLVVTIIHLLCPSPIWSLSSATSSLYKSQLDIKVLKVTTSTIFLIYLYNLRTYLAFNSSGPLENIFKTVEMFYLLFSG